MKIRERTVAGAVLAAAGAYLLLRARLHPRDPDPLVGICVEGETGSAACGGDFNGFWYDIFDRIKGALGNLSTPTPGPNNPGVDDTYEPIHTVEKPEEVY